MTRKQFFKLLVALMYLASTNDMAGFRHLLSRKMKAAFPNPPTDPAMTEMNRLTLQAINEGINPEWKGEVFFELPEGFRDKYAFKVFDGGSKIQSPFTYPEVCAAWGIG